MEEKVLHKLEYYKVIELLINQCSCQLGKDLAEELKPSHDLEEIERGQAETTEAKEIWRLYPNFTLGGIRDIRSALRKAQVGGIIDPEGFIMIYDTILAGKRIKDFFTEKSQTYPLIANLTRDLENFSGLEKQIKRCITSEGEVSDRASEKLGRIRKQLTSLQGKAREKLEGVVRSPAMQKYLQDPIVTIRNERYVIPVKQEYRQKIPGLIHDQSASGATIFVEPFSVVEINNEAQRLEAQEKAEVLRILRQLTEQVGEYHSELTTNVELLGQIDFIFAKGKLSTELDCGQVKMNDRGYINIIQGRHPLIKGNVVPTTIYLGKGFDILVITGPNTGGKTVTLKTVGLFTLMAQAGLHVPAQVGTELAVFEQIFADIGDEQSIEQSLSTFSAHMTNIINIVNKVNEGTLVLLDELGAGTDPTEGAALAMAILDHLNSAGTKAIATTHYSELKSFAYNRENIENASVEFNVETLRPTYRLLIGMPGKSNAFEISKRLGLKCDVIERAKEFLSKDEIKVADLIANLETNEILSEKKRQEAELLKQQAQKKILEMEKREQELKEKTQRIIDKAQEEALEIVARARKESETVLKEIRGVQKSHESNLHQKMQDLRQNLREKEGKLQEAVFKEQEGTLLKPQDLQPGDLVLIKRLNQKAQVLEKPTSNGEVLIQAGIMKITAKLKELSKVRDNSNQETDNSQRNKTGVGTIVSTKARDISNELDLRGLTVDEALLVTEKYLDDAFLAGLSQISIIHGKGTGALRSAITKLLKRHHGIKAYRVGGFNEGGHGVTIAELKK